MAATALPSSGGVPAKTCDASGMADIHRWYRAGFAEAPNLVRGVAPGDLAHAELVATHLNLLSTYSSRYILTNYFKNDILF